MRTKSLRHKIEGNGQNTKKQKQNQNQRMGLPLDRECRALQSYSVAFQSNLDHLRQTACQRYQYEGLWSAPRLPIR